MGKIADAIRGTGLAQQKVGQLLTLDQEFSALESKVQMLETENLKLRAEVNPLKAEIERIKQQIKQKEIAKYGPANLDPMAEKLLLFIAGRRTPTKVIYEGLEISQAKGDYFLDSLKERDFIFGAGADLKGLYFGATAAGRKYLAEHNLL